MQFFCIKSAKEWTSRVREACLWLLADLVTRFVRICVVRSMDEQGKGNWAGRRNWGRGEAAGLRMGLVLVSVTYIDIVYLVAGTHSDFALSGGRHRSK